MRRRRRDLALAACLLGLAATVEAAGAGPSQVAWAARLDVQRIMRSSWGDAVREAAARPEAKRKLAALEVLTGVNLLDDIRSITLAGEGQGPEGAALYVEGNLDRSRLTAVAALAESYKCRDYAGRTIHSWLDEGERRKAVAGRRCHAAFAADDLLVFALSEETLEGALDAIDGNAASPAEDFRLALAREGAYLAGKASGLNRIERARVQTAVLEHVEELGLALRGGGEELELSLTAATEGVETAERIRRVLEGLKALVLLDAARLPAQAELAAGAEIEQDRSTVRLTLTASRDLLERLEESRKARRPPWKAE
jgi:hypothetical protein